MKSFRKRIITLIGLLLTVILSLVSDFILKLPKETTWMTFFVGSIVTITVTLLGQEIEESIDNTEYNFKKALANYSLMYDNFENLGDENLQYQIISLLDTLKKGEVPAFMAASRTRHLIMTAKTSCVSIYPIRQKQELYDWVDYPRHRTWLRDNYDAVKRGVKVERTFILKKSEFYIHDQWDEKALTVLSEQAENGILIRLIWYEDFQRAPTHMGLEQIFTIIDGKEVIHDEGKGNNRLYRMPSVKVQEFNDIWQEHKKYAIDFPGKIVSGTQK
jgi:hypothetical protein